MEELGADILRAGGIDAGSSSRLTVRGLFIVRMLRIRYQAGISSSWVRTPVACGNQRVRLRGMWLNSSPHLAPLAVCIVRTSYSSRRLLCRQIMIYTLPNAQRARRCLLLKGTRSKYALGKVGYNYVPLE